MAPKPRSGFSIFSRSNTGGLLLLLPERELDEDVFQIGQQRTHLLVANAAAAEFALQLLPAHAVAQQGVDGAPKNRGAADLRDLARAAQRAGDFRRSDLEAMHARRIHFRQGA